MKINRNKFTTVIKAVMLFIFNIAILPIQVDASDNDMQARYRRAQDLVIDVYSGGGPVLNATVYPTRVKNNNNFWYKRQLKNGYEYRLIDVRKKTNKTAFDHEDLANALGKATGQHIQPHALAITGESISQSPFKLNFQAFDKYWQFAEGHLQEVEATPVKGIASPDGNRSVFVKNHNIWLYDKQTGEKQALTHDGEDGYRYAAAGSAWGPAFDSGLPQVKWSPDGKKIYTVQRDLRQVAPNPKIHFAPPSGSGRAQVENEYFAVTADQHVGNYRLLVIDIATGKITEPAHPHLTHANNGWGFFEGGLGWWAQDSKHAYFVEQQRGDQRVRVIEFDVNTGTTRVLFTEITDTYFKFTPDSEKPPMFRPLPETEELIWFSERSGWGHLYLIDMKTGKVKNAITRGDWLVRDIVHVDAERRELLIQTSGRVPGRNPYYRDIARVNMDTGKLTNLVASNHDYNMLAGNLFYDVPEDMRAISRDGQYFVATRSRIDDVPVSFLYDRNGEQLMTVETADISALPKGWRWPEPVKLKAADGKTDIYGAIFRPSDFDSTQKYPVLEYTFYAAPEETSTPLGSFTNNTSIGRIYMIPAAYAELGFIVVTVDGRGGPFRSKKYQDHSYGWTPSTGSLEDRVAGIKQMAQKYPYMDLSRVGTTGLRGNTQGLYSLLEYPDFYKAAIIQEIHDTRVMTSIWGDRYEGVGFQPANDPRHYEHNLHKLKGNLMIVHGMLDVYNPPSGAFKLVEALKNANKDFDLLLLPNNTGLLEGYSLRRSWDWLVENLMGATPPSEFRLKISSDE